MSKIHDRVVERINKEIGKEVKNLSNVKFVIEHYKKQFEDIEKKLNTSKKETKSFIKDALNKAELSQETILIENEKLQTFQKNLNEKLLKSDEIITSVKPMLKEIEYYEHMIEYLKIVGDIQEINKSLTSTFKSNKDESKLVGYFLSLCGEPDSNNSILGRLENCNTKYLKDYALKSAVYWHSTLIEKFSADFEAVLKQIKWGQQGQVLDLVPSKDATDKLSTLAEYLFLIKSPAEDSDNWKIVTPSIVCAPISIPTTLLIRPFRQKFIYHFTGTRQTNRLDKPEWYFTQIINWAKETHLFVGKYFQPAAVRAGHKNFNVRLEYIRGLVQICIEKLAHDIEEISKDGCLFAHLIDETLAFELEIREILGYPSSFPSAICVLTQPHYLLKWISVEEQFCTDQMDLLLQNDNNPWQLIEPSVFEDEQYLKIPKCADQFIRLLDAIKERYCLLTQPGHKLQFLNLQLELLDNFRRRLVQLFSIDAIESTKVLNAINYICCVLREWGEHVHYLHLHAALMGLNASEINSVFVQPIEELEHWQKQLLNELSSKIVDEIKAKSMSYRHENWFNMQENNNSNKEPCMLSISAGEMFQLMVTTFHNLEKELSMNLLEQLLRKIANQLDEFFLYSLILNTKFSTGGALQFQYDMIRNLFPIFGQFIRRPHLLFKKIHDSCILLNIPQGNALLLYQTLKDDICIDDKIKSLRELGILSLDPEISLNILERRNNLRVY